MTQQNQGAADARGAQKPLNSPAQVLTASLIGTTIEFFDFYVYATAAVLIFPALFFPSSDPMTALLASFLALFVRRPDPRADSGREHRRRGGDR